MLVSLERPSVNEVMIVCVTLTRVSGDDSIVKVRSYSVETVLVIS